MKTKEEIEILRADALAGDSRAQNDLGCAYSSGDGVTKKMKSMVCPRVISNAHAQR